MAFESLTDKLQNVFKKLRSKGRLTESDIKRIDDVVNVDLNLIRLGTYDPERYKDILFALKQFYAFSKRFNGSDENELLATMGTAATQCLLGLSEEAYKTGKPIREIDNFAIRKIRFDHAEQIGNVKELVRNEVSRCLSRLSTLSLRTHS